MKAAIVLFGVVAILGIVLASPYTYGEVDKLNALPAPNAPQRILEDVINNTINAVVAIVAKYDPFDVEHKEENFLGHQGKIQNLHVEGFSNVVATHIKLSGLITWTLELTIEAPKILGTLEQWKVDGEVFYGTGTAKVEINDLKVKVKAKINPISMQIKELLITPSIGDADVLITGLYDDEELSQNVSNYFNVLLNDVINNDEELHKQISEIILEILQDFLDSFYGH